MSSKHSRARARNYRHASASEMTIFGLELVILIALAGITYFMGYLNVTGFSSFGFAGIVAGLLLAGGAGMVYTANNHKETLHMLGLVILIFYVLGLILEFFYRIGAWFVNVAQSGTLGWFAALLVGLFILFELMLSVADAHAQHMR